MAYFYIRAADNIWVPQVGWPYHPLKLRVGAEWRTIADPPDRASWLPTTLRGGPLKLRHTDGTWILISYEGWGWGTVTGRVYNFNGVPLANRYVQLYWPTVLRATRLTDADGRYTFEIAPVGESFQMVAYLRPNNQEGFQSSGTILLTNEDKDQIYDFHLNTFLT